MSQVLTGKMRGAIQKKALELGFAACGFAPGAALPDDRERLRDWLDKGRHAGMAYMANHFEKRCDPRLLVDGARSVISLLYNYKTSAVQDDPAAPVLSSYAFGRDYHFVLKEKLHALFDFIRELYPSLEGRVFVDSAPVLDRAWARQAGLGWIGKNGMLISRSSGSFVFIGEIVSNLEVEEDPLPEPDRCGSCTRCIDACPTGAILNGRQIDAGRCLSYQTIENRADIPSELHDKLQNRVFGCDICQDVCPWNRKAPNHRDATFDPSPGLLEMSRAEWIGMDREIFNRLFRDSPVKRAGFAKLKSTLALLSKKDPS